MSQIQKVLVTGLSGLIGGALRTELEPGFELSALNRSRVIGIKTTQADLADYDAIQPAFVDQDTVIHLAAVIHDGVGWDALHQTNVIGTRNVFEAAAAAGVKRVVFTSSGATVAGFEKVSPYKELVSGSGKPLHTEDLIREDMAVRPANMYASTKVWGEAIARHYADNHGLEVVCLRIGFANAEDRPMNARQMAVWNSQRDVVQAIRLAMEMALETDDRFDCFFITSDNRYGYRDLTRARTLLGFQPLDSADTHS